MSGTTRGIKQRTVAGVALLLLGLASMFLGFSATTASADPVTCDSSGFIKGANEDKPSGSGTYDFGTLSWSGSTLTYNVNAGYTVSLCVKAGSESSVEDGPIATKTVEGPAQGTLVTNGGKNISHVGYNFNQTTTPSTPVSTPTTPVSTPTTPVSTPTTPVSTPIETLPTEETTPIETLPTEETTPIETLPTEGTDPGDPKNPGDPNQPADKDPDVLGIEQNAPAAAPTAVDAGLSGAESDSSSTLWILAGAALALAGLVMGFVPVAPRGKRAL